jgi:exopolysaccharide production protein ExoQ
MVSAIATVICVAFVAYLFARDLRSPQRETISWAPFVWMFFAGSRFASAWLDLRTPSVGVEAYAEGSPADRAVFLLLIIWGATVLYRREIQWRQLFVQNKWLVAYLLYCLLSIMWTDEPVVLIKRWVKDLGNPIMVLVLLTERRPYIALVTTVRRLAYVLLPLSVLFIRYYPELGRGYSVGGGVMYTGVADQKNTLGLLCLIAGIGYVWRVLFRRELTDRNDLVIVAMLAWLLYMANSKTSLTCLILAVAILVCSKIPTVAVQPTRVVALTLYSTILFVAADALFEVQDHVLSLLGRDATLTNRTELWDTVKALQTNALVGTGFMSFWAGDRMEAVWRALGPGVNQAHNGYLEQYLNLGYVGIAFIIAIASSALINVRKRLPTDYPTNVLRLCVIVTAMLYNYTEASFYGINNMWVLFLVGTIDLPSSNRALNVAPAHAIRPARRPTIAMRPLASATDRRGVPSGRLRPKNNGGIAQRLRARRARRQGNVSGSRGVIHAGSGASRGK